MRINIFFTIAILLSVNFLAAQDTDNFTEITNTESFKTKLINHANSTISIRSDFTQEKHLQMLEEILISEGEFIFKHKNNVRWQYNSPIKYTILIHNKTFTIVNNNKINEFKVDENPIFKEINNMIIAAIRGDFINNKDFNSAFFESDTSYLSVLTPTNSMVSSMLSTIKIYFNKQNMNVTKVIFMEPGDDFTMITFKNKEINGKIPDELFMIEK